MGQPARKSRVASCECRSAIARRVCRYTKKQRYAVTPMMAVFNNLVLFDQHVAQNTFESIRPDLAERLVMGRGQDRAHFSSAHGVKWHDGVPFTAKDVKCTWDTLRGGPARNCGSIRARAGTGTWPKSQSMVTTKSPFICNGRSLICSRCSRRGVAGLPMPRVARADAATSDRHRPVQIRRIQAERTHQSGAQSGLLEAGPPLPRRHRIYDHPERIDADAGLCRRQVRFHLRHRSRY